MFGTTRGFCFYVYQKTISYGNLVRRNGPHEQLDNRPGRGSKAMWVMSQCFDFTVGGLSCRFSCGFGGFWVLVGEGRMCILIWRCLELGHCFVQRLFWWLLSFWILVGRCSESCTNGFVLTVFGGFWVFDRVGQLWQLGSRSFSVFWLTSLTEAFITSLLCFQCLTRSLRLSSRAREVVAYFSKVKGKVWRDGQRELH